MSMETPTFGAPSSMQLNPGTNCLELRWWRLGNPAEGERATVDELMVVIPPEDMIDFLSRLNADAWHAVQNIARDYGEGDCDTCGNRRTVDVVRNDRPWNIACPTCRPVGSRRGEPFANRPRLRSGTWDATTRFEDLGVDTV